MKEVIEVMTPYPIKGLTKGQKEVFEDIAVGSPRHLSNFRLAAVNKLLSMGAIEYCGLKRICADRFGEVLETQYQVPIPLHAAWCKWCDENFDEEGNEKLTKVND